MYLWWVAWGCLRDRGERAAGRLNREVRGKWWVKPQRRGGSVYAFGPSFFQLCASSYRHGYPHFILPGTPAAPQSFPHSNLPFLLPLQQQHHPPTPVHLPHLSSTTIVTHQPPKQNPLKSLGDIMARPKKDDIVSDSLVLKTTDLLFMRDNVSFFCTLFTSSLRLHLWLHAPDASLHSLLFSTLTLSTPPRSMTMYPSKSIMELRTTAQTSTMACFFAQSTICHLLPYSTFRIRSALQGY